MTMDEGQRAKAIDKLLDITALTDDDLSDYEDYELGQFLYEQGYTWDEWNKEWVLAGAEVEA